MMLRKRRHVLLTGILIIPLAAVLISRLPSCGNRPHRDEEGRGTTLAGHTFPVQALAFGPDGATLTSAAFYTEGLTAGVEVMVWDAGTGHSVAKRIEHLGGIHSLVFAPGGRRLAAVQERTLLLCDVAPWHERRLEGLRPFASALAFSDDGTQLAAADFDDLTLWDITGSRPKACWTKPDGAVSLAFSPGGTVVASGGADSIIRLWDAATGRPRGSLQGHAKPVMVVAFARDGVTLASAEFRGAVKLWDLATLTERATLEMGGEEISIVAFAPDGRTLAVAVGPAVQLWDMSTGRHIVSLEGRQGQVNCLAYSADGTRLASGGHDRTVRLRDTTLLPAKP
jgi:WD40 repeat protein